MSELWAFIDPHTSFDILRTAADKYSLHLVLRRYTKHGVPASVHLVQPGENAATLFNEGGYSRAFLTTATPKDRDDLRFLDSEEHRSNSIEMAGGRTTAHELEQCNIRIMSKQTNARSAFNAIRRAMKKVCERGVLVAGKWPNPRAYWERSLAGDSRTWRRVLGEDIACTPLAGAD